jgi:cytochrome d ubiquinol oxidase subunit II
MFAIFAVLDGFDMGVGIVHLIVARTDAERRVLLQSIGPVWDGNEVWLIAGGGTLFFAFPAAYASGFSGFYLPLMIVLWLLILRGIAVEFRDHITSPVWTPFWDVVFAGASALLALFFGAALGNVMRGVPLDANQSFFLPLWTNFRIGADPGILDWFTTMFGLASVATLTMHGAIWLAMKTRGELQTRARNLARLAWTAVVLLTVVLMVVVPLTLVHFSLRYAARPWGLIFPVAAIGGLASIRILTGVGRDPAAFLCSCTYVLAMLAAAAFGHYPYLLPAIGDAQTGLTIYNASTSSYGMRVGLVWFLPGLMLVRSYFVFAYRHIADRLDTELMSGGDLRAPGGPHHRNERPTA